MKTLWLFFLCCLTANVMVAQSAETASIENELIVRVANSEDFTELYRSLTKSFGPHPYQQIARNFHLYLLEDSEDGKLHDWLIRQGIVLSVTRNRTVSPRLSPNDELYQEQWALPLIGMENVWDNAKADVTPQGDSIVIAIFDDGYLQNHPDLNAQTWKNSGEIPDDNQDNDQNGYIDDYYGWNFRTSTDEHNTGGHGSPVAGIAGASGDNGIGISGVALNTKLLPLTPSLRFTEIFESMDYAYALRKKYNESDGQEGAFIVAANFSLGVDGSFPNEVEPWCDLHDSLGNVGILSVGSVTNSSVDVSIEGDIPTLCPSPYLITVTQTNKNDELPSDEGGYNSLFVDLAAPGDGILSTSSNFDYREFDGSSAAAPLVSGAIASLYSVPCPTLTAAAKEAPAETALRMKSLIMGTTVSRPSLEGRSVSGGRLDVFAAVLAATEFCAIETAPFEIQRTFPNPTQGNFTIDFTIDKFDPIQFRMITTDGKTIWDYDIVPEVFGERTIEVKLEGRVPQGLYLLEMVQNGKKIVRSIVIS